MSQTIHLAAGTLNIEVHKAHLPLNDLLDFASRTNPKRGYLFVSKVLGKHIPCKPSTMRDIYHRLATPLLEVPGPVIFIGMAETATGLGAGVADSLARKAKRRDVVFQHTTRHRLPVSEWICFDEVHSHAPGHILYRPLPTFQQRFAEAQTLVLVDDEISTGRTLSQLGYKLSQKLSNVRQVILVSIINWLSPEQKQAFQEKVGKPVSFINLLEGTFSFTPNPAFRPSLPGKVESMQPALQALPQMGRRGIGMGEKSLIPNGPYPKEHKVSVVGTGEFQFQPFLWAEWLEKRGFDILFQSTTRSPVQLGGPICESLRFKDEYGEGVDNYLHNPPCNREIIIAYEHAKLAQNHSLPEQLGGSVWGVDRSALLDR
ncbi:phosphoribosyltransferase domain-containing protein [Nitrosococcus wardiae]|uniref:Phosphoribosyltransferase n=1 Tax=Nitrosococcus wardiae TaxID=1814290 RepID=A0A4P7BZ00_9GAMM|nr:phosphoribosyltransferase domain-containing protein [Nitrosococcus wardiae]QBQ55311.1 hypothetical protein E3U44_12910 [Nitrosococcus wardiae]